MTTQNAADRSSRRRRLTKVLGYVGVGLSFATLAALGLGPRTGRYQVLTMLTGSMAPAIPAGSVIVVRPVDPAQLRVGDVVTYRIPVQDRRIVTHRVVELVETGATPILRTQGDALEEPDQWTTRFGSEPAWRVETHVPYAGHALRAVQDPQVRQALVVGAPALLALALLAGIWRPSRRDQHAQAEPAPTVAPVPFDGVIVLAPGHVRLPDLTTTDVSVPDPRSPLDLAGPARQPGQRHDDDVAQLFMRELTAVSSSDWSRDG